MGGQRAGLERIVAGYRSDRRSRRRVDVCGNSQTERGSSAGRRPLSTVCRAIEPFDGPICPSMAQSWDRPPSVAAFAGHCAQPAAAYRRFGRRRVDCVPVGRSPHQTSTTERVQGPSGRGTPRGCPAEVQPRAILDGRVAGPSSVGRPGGTTGATISARRSPRRIDSRPACRSRSSPAFGIAGRPTQSASVTAAARPDLRRPPPRTFDQRNSPTMSASSARGLPLSTVCRAMEPAESCLRGQRTRSSIGSRGVRQWPREGCRSGRPLIWN